MINVHVPEKRTSFGEQLGAALGGGVSHGISQHFEQKFKKELEREKSQIDFANQMAIEKAKLELKDQKEKEFLSSLGINLNKGSFEEKTTDQMIPTEDFNIRQVDELPTKSPNVSNNLPLHKRLNEDQIAAISLKYPKFAEVLQSQNEAEIKRYDAAWNYKPVQEYITRVDESAENAYRTQDIANEFENLVNSGKIDPKNPRAYLASKYGEKFPFLFDENTAQAKLLEKMQAAGIKEYFPKPTEREFFFINSANAQLGKTDAANKAVLDLQRRFADIAIKASEFKNDVINENNGMPPRDLPAQVQKRMTEYRNSLINEAASITFKYGDAKQKEESIDHLKTTAPKGQVLMRFPGGKLGYIDKSKVKTAQERGGELL
jgi:hypothetical protein